MIARQSSVAVQQFHVVTGAPSRYDHRVSLFTPLGGFGYHNQVIAGEHSLLVGFSGGSWTAAKAHCF